MTDPVDPVHMSDAEASVRALLAEAGGPVTMPADVAGRLDGVLADLADERRGAPELVVSPESAVSPDSPGSVVSLESRRRRRWPQLLVAAAAVGALGYVGSNGLLGSGTGSDDRAVTADRKSTDGQPELDASGGADAPSTPGDGQDQGSTLGPQPTEIGGTAGDRVDSPALRNLIADPRFSRAYAAVPRASADKVLLGRCSGPQLRGDDTSQVLTLSNGLRAVVVLRRPGSPVVQVYACHQPYLPIFSALALGLD